MNSHTPRSLAAVLSVLTLAGTALVSQAPSAALGQPGTHPSEEFLLLGNPNRGAGEPMIFVNPRDPANMIVVAMATLNRLPSGETPIVPRGTPEATLLRVKELSTPDGSRTDIAVTSDGGKTWRFSEDDFRKAFDKNRCSDSFAGAGPDGTLYMGCLAYLNRGAADFDMGYAPNGEARNMRGGSAIASSHDKGRTWTFPVWVHPAQSPSLYAAGLNPVFEQASPWDRPYFAADASTGTIYVSGSGPSYTVDPKTVNRPAVNPSLPGMGYTGYPPATVTRSRTFIRASRDQARTWGVIYAIDSDAYPGARGSFSAAHGHLVVAYTATQLPTGEQCPCTVFGTSENEGKSFTYRVVPPLTAATSLIATTPAATGPGRGGPAGRGLGGVMVGADATRANRYAIARQSGQSLLVSITADGGLTWLPPVIAAQIPDGATFGHRAMRYSARGDLGLIWKTVYSDRSFDVWSAVSRDGGRSFKTVRVSHAVSPTYLPERGNFMFGDDLSSLDLDGEFLHVVWGDNRSGFQGTWYGRVPLSAY